MFRKSLVQALFVVFLGVSLSGCASWFFDEDSQANISEKSAEIKSRLASAQDNYRDSRPFMATQAWVGGSMVYDPVRHERLESETIKFAMNGVTLPEIIVRLSELTDLNIKLNSDLGEKPKNRDSESDSKPTSTDSTGKSVQLAASSPLSPLSLMGASAPQNTRKNTDIIGNPLTVETSISVQGPVRQALDLVASKFGISWRFSEAENTIEFFRVETRSFQVFFPGGTTQDVTVGKSEGEDSVIEQETQYENSGGNWDEIKAGIESILSPYGRANILQSTGSVVVSDTPQNLRFIGEYVEKINEIYGRQVYLEFRVVSVTMRDNNQFQATWSNILQTIRGGKTQIGLESNGTVLSELGNQLNIIQTNNGANLALELLATKANLAEVTTHSVTTLSNQPAPIRVVTDTGYISGINQEAGTSGQEAIISEVETSTIDTGFSVTLLPRVQNAERLQLQIAMEISNLLELKSFDDTVIQTPTLDRRALVQRAWLNSGHTLVMSGFMSDRERLNLTGSGNAGFWGLGGGRSSDKDQQVLMVLITPYIQSGAYSG